jgi:small GTP-binding protein
MTIGMNYATHYMNTPEDRVELQLWDYGGQLKYRPLLTKFLEGTSGALLMFDLTRFASFNELDEWHNLLESKLQEKIPILLVGCKLDLCEQDPSEGVVPEKEIYAYMQRRKCLDFIKTSAKTGKNIQLCFEKIVNALLHKSDR